MKTSIQALMSNQTNELKNMMASFFQMNIVSTSGLGPLPSNTIANPKGEMKSITTRSGLVLDGPSVPMPPPFINPKEDECVEETLMDPKLESVNMINIYDDSCEDYLEDLFATNHLSGNPTFCSHTDLTSPEVINSLSGSTTSSSPNHLLEEFFDELALITFPLGNDDLSLDIEFNLRKIGYLLNHDPTKEMDSILEDSVDKDNLANPNENLFYTIFEMFTDEHARDYSPPPLYDDFYDDLDEFESDNEYVYDDPFDSKEDKINESKLLIDELDPLRTSDFLPSPKYDSFLFEDFSEVDALPSTNNEDKVFNPGILIHENLSEVTV
nr:hypothetical protein [Tanacetum cinerariifolium]